MPRYDYDCAACGRRFEVFQGVHAERPTTCPLCGSGPVKKAFAAPAVHFKGSGWAKRDRRAPAKSGSSSTSGDDGASETGSTGGVEPAAATATISTDEGAPPPPKPSTKSPAPAAD